MLLESLENLIFLLFPNIEILVISIFPVIFLCYLLNDRFQNSTFLTFLYISPLIISILIHQYFLNNNHKVGGKNNGLKFNAFICLFDHNSISFLISDSASLIQNKFISIYRISMYINNKIFLLDSQHIIAIVISVFEST